MGVKQVDCVILCYYSWTKYCEKKSKIKINEADVENTRSGLLIFGSWRKIKAKKTMEYQKMKGSTVNGAAKKQRMYLIYTII